MTILSWNISVLVGKWSFIFQPDGNRFTKFDTLLHAILLAQKELSLEYKDRSY